MKPKTLKKQKIIAVLPAYQAAKTLVPFLKTFPKDLFDEIILVDDGSTDNTFKIAKEEKGLKVFKNTHNLGYGGNMKRCLNLALEYKADIIVEIHPDGEYGTNGIKPALKEIGKGSKLVLGNRFKSYTDALNSGMFFWKYPLTKLLTFIDNLVLGTNISDLHQGFRVYSRQLLESVNFDSNSNDFLFTFQIICQAVFQNKKVTSVPVQAFYKGSKRGVVFTSGIKYFFGTFLILGQFILARLGIRSNCLLQNKK